MAVINTRVFEGPKAVAAYQRVGSQALARCIAVHALTLDYFQRYYIDQCLEGILVLVLKGRVDRPKVVIQALIEMGLWIRHADDSVSINGFRLQIDRRVTDEVRRRWKGRCAYCGEVADPFHVDHVVPISRGGTSSKRNLVLACEQCNLSKGTKTAAEFGYPQLMPSVDSVEA